MTLVIKDEMLILARKLAEKQLVLTNLGMMNVPDDLESKLDLSARYQLAFDEVRMAQSDYANALKRYSLEQRNNESE